MDVSQESAIGGRRSNTRDGAGYVPKVRSAGKSSDRAFPVDVYLLLP
jgi:hypothetical protein